MKLRRPNRWDAIVGAIFLALNVADAWITLKALHTFPGLFEEGNPIMRYLISQSESLFWGVKVGVSLLISGVTSVLVMPRRATVFVLACSAILGVVVISNIVHYLYALSTG